MAQNSDKAGGVGGNFSWSDEHDHMLCREVLIMEIHKFPKRSKERGDIWSKIAESLNGTKVPKFNVSKRSVRDRLTLLINKYKEKVRKEEAGSGIVCDDETEVELAVAEIITKEQAADLERKENSNALTKKDENDKASAEEVRMKAMERLSQTKKRNADSLSGCNEITPPKSRKNASEAVQCLKEKFAQESEIRREELELKKKEQESQITQHQMIMDQQRQQQQFQMLFLQQQQQQSQMLMAVLEKVLPKSSKE